MIKADTNISDIQQAKGFLKLHLRSRSNTVTSVERQFALYKAVRYIITKGLPGDFVECGVGGGGSMMLVAMTLARLGVTNRRLWLYDTFAGMPNPSKHDVDFRELTAAEVLKRKGRKNPGEQSNHSLARVQKCMRSSGYPQGMIEYVQGRVEDTIPGKVPKKIALLRLDTDWYESTSHELQQLYPLLVQHGVLIIDDYGHWRGCRKAVDEYFEHRAVLLNRIDYTGRIAVKL